MECKVGDRVELQITGVVARYIGVCISTPGEPLDGTLSHDHPRFEVVGIWNKEEGVVSDETSYKGVVLKPSDYILMGKWDSQ